MKISLYQVLMKNAHIGLDIQRKDGSMPSGYNGPYHDPETSVRTTAHWVLIFKKAHQISAHAIFLEAAIKGLNYIVDTGRPLNKVFYCRNKRGKDKCNGLIGQAWAMEALLCVRMPKYGEIAKEVFLFHKFNHVLGFWNSIDLNGKVLPIDKTFNHQLWFAAIGSLIDDSEVKSRVIRFMDCLERNIGIHKNGLIRHLIFSKITTPLYLLSNKIKGSLVNANYLYNKEIGYHAFNLYALSLLKNSFPNHSFWQSKKFKSIVDFSFSNELLDIAFTNKYGSQYNPVGIELAFFLCNFEDQNNKISFYLEKQFNQHLDLRSCIMDKNTSDDVTLSARIYEATRFRNYDLNIN